jgi:ADP-heptose:LPS heptosyltransferase
VGLCDLFVSLVSWHSASLAYLRDALQATATIGFDASFDVALPRIYTKHTSKLMFDAVLAIDASLRFDKFLSPRPPYSQHARDTARAIKGPLRAGLKLVAVHTETTAAKTWPAAQWGRVLHGFLKPRPEWIALLVDYQRQLPTLADADTEAQVVDATGLPLEEALCLVQHADLFVGVDSSMLHAADFGDVPSVGLFISTSAREFGFLLAPHVAIEAASAEAIDCNRVAEAIDAVTVNSAMRSIVRV